MDREIIPQGPYLVYADTGEKVVFYECDPIKNTECNHLLCRSDCGDEDEGNFGFCAKTTNPAFAKAGSRKWHAVLKPDFDGGEPYWGREYIEEADPNENRC